MEHKGMPPPYSVLENTNSPMGGHPSAPSYGFVNDQQPKFQPVQPAPPTPTVQSNVVVVNAPGMARGCPVCHNNSWTGTYSCLAWLCCIFCFPCGIICCCCMRKKKCNKCGFVAG